MFIHDARLCMLYVYCSYSKYSAIEKNFLKSFLPVLLINKILYFIVLMELNMTHNHNPDVIKHNQVFIWTRLSWDELAWVGSGWIGLYCVGCGWICWTSIGIPLHEFG